VRPDGLRFFEPEKMNLEQKRNTRVTVVTFFTFIFVSFPSYINF